jgi:DNA-binding CsgD family transcriptional regulator
MVASRRLSPEEQAEVWDRLARGERSYTIGAALGCDRRIVKEFVVCGGGVRPRPRKRSKRCLRLEEREEISRGLAQGESLRAIADRLGRALDDLEGGRSQRWASSLPGSCRRPTSVAPGPTPQARQARSVSEAASRRRAQTRAPVVAA